jgi:hypothetical protein
MTWGGGGDTYPREHVGSEVGVGIDLPLPGGDPHVALVHPAVQQTKFHDFKLIFSVGQVRSETGFWQEICVIIASSYIKADQSLITYIFPKEKLKNFKRRFNLAVVQL